MSTKGSFYTDGGVYDEADVVDNVHETDTTPSQAPSSFYQDGSVYDTLVDEDVLRADMQALRDATAADKAAADTDAANAAASAAAAAAYLASFNANGATATPLMDGVAAVGVANKWAREDHRHPSDTAKADAAATTAALALKAPLASPALTGTPTAPTPTAGDNSTKISTTAFVAAAIAALVNSSPAALDTLQELAAALGNDANFATTMTNALALKAPLASPALTGNPTAPTPTAGDNDTSIATTAFVGTAITNAAVPPATVNPLMDGTAAVGVATKYAREDHRHPTDTSLAPLASPTFTGVPTAPTATVGTNTTQIATTAFVLANAGSGGGASVTVSDTPPASPSAGNLWWQSSTGNLFIYYNDGNSSQWVAVQATIPKPSGPTVTLLNSGSAATYTTPVGCTRLRVRGIGGGGGSGTLVGSGQTAGGTTSFAGTGITTMTATGGAFGTGANGSAAAGGVGSNGQLNYNGDDGVGCVTQAAGAFYPAQRGGGTFMYPSGPAGAAAPTNTGRGAGVPLFNGAGSSAGAGAGGGGFERWINSPASTYTYTIGTAGAAGTGGFAGAAGQIAIEEFYD